jgi:hypothetical protein
MKSSNHLNNLKKISCTKYQKIAKEETPKLMTQTWQELRDEYANENYPPFGGPFTDALDPWEWLSKNFESPKRLEETKKEETAVTFLISEFLKNKLFALRYDKDNVMNEIVARANQIFKEQIINAWEARDKDVIKSDGKDAEQYYNEKYGKK